jgi:IclR family acetate operon transcriptional repressor
LPKNKKSAKGSALEKALLVLETIVDQPQSVGLPDLTERLGISRQSVHRLVQQLEQQGLVYKVPKRDRYAIGRRFSRLALRALSSANKGAPILAILQKIVEDCGESCALGVIVGQEYVYLERAEARHYPRVFLETGGTMPPHCTSGGKAMLAFLSPANRARLLNALALKEYTRHTITSRDALNRELERIRKQGFATGDQEFAEGIVGVGVPIFGPQGEALAGLGIHAPTARLSLDEAYDIARMLQVRAKQIAISWDIDDALGSKTLVDSHNVRLLKRDEMSC